MNYMIKIKNSTLQNEPQNPLTATRLQVNARQLADKSMPDNSPTGQCPTTRLQVNTRQLTHKSMSDNSLTSHVC